MPTVSVIIPVFNRQDVLPRAVGSVLSQTFADYELIVLDDGSAQPVADAIGSVLEEPNVRLVEHEVNRGAAAARNTGVREADGRYIAFLDSDDVWVPDKLEQQIAFMQATPDCRASCTGFALVNDGTVIDRRHPPQISDLNEILWGCRVSPGSTLVIERSLYETVGPMDETLERLEDWDWMIGAAKHASFYGLRKILVDVHHDGYAHVDEAKFVAAARKIAQAAHENCYGLSRQQQTVLLSAVQYELAATYYRKRHFGSALRALAASFFYCPTKRPAHVATALKTVAGDIKTVLRGPALVASQSRLVDPRRLGDLGRRGIDKSVTDGNEVAHRAPIAGRNETPRLSDSAFAQCALDEPSETTPFECPGDVLNFSVCLFRLPPIARKFQQLTPNDQTLGGSAWRRRAKTRGVDRCKQAGRWALY